MNSDFLNGVLCRFSQTNSNRFDIDLLKTLIAAADIGSVKFASKRVARSSAAVSMQTKKLEQIVGGPVFQRSPDGMCVSNTSERLMPQADSTIHAHDSAIVAMQSTKDEGLVGVGISLENSETRMPEILSGFARAHPYVTVDIEAGDAQDLALMMAAKELDIAILTSGGGVQPQ